MRFGNKAFRLWIDQALNQSNEDLNFIPKQHLPELRNYLFESFGSYDKLEYGTLHELNFMVFLMGLYKIKVLKKADLAGTVNKVFEAYVALIRKIIEKYELLPYSW